MGQAKLKLPKQDSELSDELNQRLLNLEISMVQLSKNFEKMNERIEKLENRFNKSFVDVEESLVFLAKKHARTGLDDFSDVSTRLSKVEQELQSSRLRLERITKLPGIGLLRRIRRKLLRLPEPTDWQA